MKKYKIYFERGDIEPIEIIITGDGDNCRVGNVKVKNENFSFNFQNTEENLIKAIRIRLAKYGVEKIEQII